MGRIENRTAIITGGHTEISQAIARCFITEGAKVFLLGPGEDEISDICRTLDPTGERLSGMAADPTKETDILRVVTSTLQKTGRIDILVNHMDLLAYGPVSQWDPVLWIQMMETNACAPWQFMSAVIPEMQRVGGGAIITISSIAGSAPFSGMGVYGASHSALQALSRVLAKEVAPDNIRVNLICPAVVEDKDPEGSQEIELRGRNGNPDDVADAALYLVSDQSAWLTGLTLDLDGGRHLAATLSAK